MKKVLFSIIFLSLSVGLLAQSAIVGKITDAETGEGLISASVSAGDKGAMTDFDGNYRLELSDGTYKVIVSYVGYTTIERSVTLSGSPVTLDLKLSSGETMTEITVTADIARERETPVAFSNIPTIKLQEELAAQDLPMILNSTPGAYATNSGGGDGDARVTIRGFNQRNVAVMLDGIPVNDMENGWVYWSNWFGLDLVTKTMQVQRGLGASKLALPSVGGTINILTKGIDAKAGVKLRQEVGSNGYLRTTLGVTSGRLKGGWGISAAGSYKQGNGWVDANYTQGYFYYLRIDKEFGNHRISLSGFGAPQKHGQRSYTTAIGIVDTTYARELDVPSSALTSSNVNRGLRYNQHWGMLNGEQVNTRQNYYHKPQFSLRHSWQANEKFFLSNVAYLSIGNGGGTGTVGTFNRINDPTNEFDGQLDLDKAYITNSTETIFNQDLQSRSILRSSINNHFWYGLLSTAKYEINDNFTLAGGIDLRSYKGEHYRTVHDLLGGNYFTGSRNARIDQANTQLKEGDKYYYHNDGFVRWAGIFSLLEYKNEKMSAFVNVSSAASGYKMVDYMFAKQVNTADDKFYVSYGFPVENNGTLYTVDNPSAASIAMAESNSLNLDSTTAQNQMVDWTWRPSFTFKTGMSYKIDKKSNVFVNAGYLSRATRFSNIISSSFNGADTPLLPDEGRIFAFDNAKNEDILAVEAGYGFKSDKFSANVNGYYTYWNNKPLDRAPTVLEDPTDPDSDRIPVNVNGLAARHMGLELDFAYEITKELKFEGLASVGDWIWNSAAETTLPDGSVYAFDARGVHVGDAAQLQLGGLLRYEPIKGLYIKPKYTFFARNFANFDPESLSGSTAGRESWKLPSYGLMDLHTGYGRKVGKVYLSLRFNVLNLLNTKYIGDARNNDTFNSPAFNDFDAKSASVFFGQGRRFTTSFSVSF